MIRNKCLICNSNKFLVTIIKVGFDNKHLLNFFTNYYSYLVSKNITKKLKNFNYEVIKCIRCEFIWQKFVPNTIFLNNLYEKYIDKKSSLKKSLNKIKKSKQNDEFQFNQIENLINKKKKKISILDYGAGWGHWAQSAKNFGFNVSCLEYSRSRISYLKKNGLNTINKKKINKIKSQFDFIRCEQVIEHVSELKPTIKNLFRLLNRNGIIYISVPNGNKIINSKNFENKLIKKGPVQPLEHLNCFNNFSLNKILLINNFKKIPIIKLIYVKLFSNKFNFKNIKSILIDVYNYYFGTTLFYFKD